MEIESVDKQTPGCGPPPVVLDPRERDAIVSHLLATLGRLGDLEIAIDRCDEEECYHTGRDVLDALQLILEGGVGWSERTVEPTSLTLPHERLRSIMTRLQSQAQSYLEAKRAEHDAEQEEWEDILALKEACASVLRKTR